MQKGNDLVNIPLKAADQTDTGYSSEPELAMRSDAAADPFTGISESDASSLYSGDELSNDDLSDHEPVTHDSSQAYPALATVEQQIAWCLSGMNSQKFNPRNKHFKQLEKLAFEQNELKAREALKLFTNEHGRWLCNQSLRSGTKNIGPKRAAKQAIEWEKAIHKVYADKTSGFAYYSYWRARYRQIYSLVILGESWSRVSSGNDLRRYLYHGSQPAKKYLDISIKQNLGLDEKQLNNFIPCLDAIANDRSLLLRTDHGLFVGQPHTRHSIRRTAAFRRIVTNLEALCDSTLFEPQLLFNILHRCRHQFYTIINDAKVPESRPEDDPLPLYERVLDLLLKLTEKNQTDGKKLGELLIDIRTTLLDEVPKNQPSLITAVVSASQKADPGNGDVVLKLITLIEKLPSYRGHNIYTHTVQHALFFDRDHTKIPFQDLLQTDQPLKPVIHYLVTAFPNLHQRLISLLAPFSGAGIFLESMLNETEQLSCQALLEALKPPVRAISSARTTNFWSQDDRLARAVSIVSQQERLLNEQGDFINNLLVRITSLIEQQPSSLNEKDDAASSVDHDNEALKQELYNIYSQLQARRLALQTEPQPNSSSSSSTFDARHSQTQSDLLINDEGNHPLTLGT